MTIANPYAPPLAHVDDVVPEEDGVQPVRMWSARGRIGRLRYLAHMMGAYLLVLIPGFVSGLLQATGLRVVANVVMVAGVIAYALFIILKTIQRSHDMNWSGWTVLLSMIPIVNLIWLVGSGTKGSNRFGAPPPPNTLGVKILGLAIPVIAVIGIIAAIALPAYHDYSKRAKAVQVR